MFSEEVSKYNDRLFYGFLTFFTVVAGLVAYAVS